MLNRTVFAFIACLVSLTACQKTSVTGMSNAQTVDYFANNPEIAKSTAEKCYDFERKGFSKMSSADQTRWGDSTDGINCKNAREAAALHAFTERQRALRESARKYR